MGKRGKESPMKDEKPKHNNKKTRKQVQPNSNLKTSDEGTRPDAESDKLTLPNVVVVIDNKCRLLAEQALSKAGGEKTPKEETALASKSSSSSSKQEEILQITPIKKSPSIQVKSQSTSSRRSQRSQELKSQNKPGQTVSPTARRRRKALTRALRRLRKTTQPPEKEQPKERRTSLRLSSPLKHSLRTRKSSSASPEKVELRSSPRKRNPSHISPTNMNNIQENEPERTSSPSDASNNSSPTSPEPDVQREGQINNESIESDTDDDVQMQVLEKQVESEKEEDDGLPEVSLSLPDDTDEESSLLSPSALPASQLFRSPSSRRKKRKSLSDGLSSEQLTRPETPYSPFHTSTPITASVSSSYKLPTPLSNNRYMLGYPPSISSNPVMLRSEGSLPEKRGRGRPRKALEDVKSVSGKLYRKKLAERMAAAAEEEERRAQNIYDFHIEHSDEIEPFSYPPSANPFDDLMMDPMSAAAHQMDEFYGDEVGHSSSDLSTDPQHMRHRLHRWGDKSTFVYAKHKFVSNENKFRCDTCQVSFTALSSLKRHYGTIYHKQQEAAGRSTLDLSDILRPDRDGRMTQAGLLSGPASSAYYASTRGRGRGRPAVARTSSFVRRSAVDNIKKYYAAADAARRRRENYSTSTSATSARGTAGFTSTWLQKQQRKRKPLLHSDYLYTSADSDAEDADDDDFGCEDEINIENGIDEDETAEDTGFERPWLSNVWKGIGPPHFTCEYCGEVYTKKLEFTKHLFQHRQEEEQELALTCPDCLAVFPSEQLLEHHFKLFNHGVGVITHSHGQTDVQKITCAKCNSQFIRRDYYRKHMEVHKRPLLKCPHCSKKFLYKFYLNDHMKAKHDGLTNNFANLASNNDVGVAVDGLSASTIPNLNNININSSNAVAGSVTINNIPRPKVELYSSTTSLLTTSADVNKRKEHTTVSGSSENQCDTRNDEFSSTLPKKKNSTAAAAAATLTCGDIPVPQFITCDDDMATRTYASTHDGSDANIIAGKYERSLGTDLTASSNSLNKERVNLIQKFFDSQKEQLTLNPQERDGETKLDEETNNGSSSSSNVAYASSGLSGIEHSTTEDGKIVFQLEHSMFKGFGTMAGEDGDENACNMSPLTIEIPRDNINIDIEEEPSGVADAESNPEINNKQETCDTGTGVVSHPLPKPVDKGDGETEKEKSSAFDCTNSNSSIISSAFQLLGCGVKINLAVAVDPENELQCQDCGKVFEHKKSLIKHVRYYTQVASYPCPLCDKSFKLKHHVSRHMKSHHNVDTSSTTSSTSDDINLLEDPGDIDFLNLPPGNGDSISFGGASLLSMPGSSSSSATTIGETLLAGCAKEESAGAKPANTTGRKRSTSGSSNKKKLDSDISCQPSFSKANYTTVMDSNGSPVFKCLICKKLYPTKNQLNSHLWYHKRSIPYRCTTCSAEFKFKHDLNAHQLDHISERPKFTCEKCRPDNKSFLSRKDYLKHMREIHNYLGRKPPVVDSPTKDELSVTVSRCPHCPLVFPQDSDLSLHLSTEHGKTEAVACRTCEQVLGSSALLKIHMFQEHHIGEDGDHGDGQLVQGQDDDDDDKPPTPSPHTSPFHVIQQPAEEDEPEEAEAEPSSPEFELMEVN